MQAFLPGPGIELADLAVFDRRENIRIVVSLEGRYTLSTKRDGNGNLRHFACRVLNMSADALFMAVPVPGPVGDRVVTHLDHFGRLDGRILRCTENGLVSRLSASRADREAYVAKLGWYERYKNHDVIDQRAHKRMYPRDPISTLLLPDGSRMACFVIDMSVSGVAVSADYLPLPGAILTVGDVIGRVVRIFEEGFALNFLELEDISTLERRLIRR